MGNAVAKEQEVTRRSRRLSQGSGGVNGEAGATISQLVTLAKRAKKEKERERLREEHAWRLVVRFEETVDGGYLAPYGTYKSNMDYDSEIVRRLIVERKLAPFYTPLQDFDEDWSDSELLLRLAQLTLHSQEPEPLEEEEDMDSHKIHRSNLYSKRSALKKSIKRVKLRQLEWQREAEEKYILEKEAMSSPYIPSTELQLKLYREAQDCPICFVYYPPCLNVSRCCIQPICSECFVQIKRLDPHPPHDEQGNETNEEGSDELISEPTKCPFCAMPDFGVSYYPPNFRTGLDGVYPLSYKSLETTVIAEDDHVLIGSTSPTSIGDAINKTKSLIGTPPRHLQIPISTSPSRPNSAEQEDSRSRRKRQGSIPPNAPGVITSDMIRPDWETKLNSSRHKLARRSATASVIHASSLIYNHSPSTSSSHTHVQSPTAVQPLLSPFSGRVPPLSGRLRSETLELEERMIAEALRLSLIDQEMKKDKKSATPGSSGSSN